jgi:cytochrome P450
MSRTNTKQTPGPSGLNALRYWIQMVRDPLTAFAALNNEFGDAVQIPFTPSKRFLLLSRPEHAEHVLVRNQDRYPKAFSYRPLKAVLGDGLLTSEGETWQRHRHLVQPVFSHRHVQEFGSTIADVTRARVGDWSIGAPIDVGAEMRSLTMALIGRILFGVDLADRAQSVGNSVSRLQSALIPGAILPITLVPGLRSAARSLESLVNEIIDARLAAPHPEPHDLLDRLLIADEGKSLNRREIRDEVTTLVLAGHETTANTLTWALALLSRFPSVRERLAAEIQEVVGDRAATADDFDSLEWTRAVVSESIRLYPPAWNIERDAMADDVIGDVQVRAGDTIGISAYLIHRNREFWPNPEGFDPRRFLSANVGSRPRHAYLPFGGGRRVCVGAALAQLEATIALATIIQSRNLDLQPGVVLDARAEITLRPRRPIIATVLSPIRPRAKHLVGT